MKIRTPCSQCKVQYVDEIPLSEVTDGHIYHVGCPNGHKSKLWLQNNKFELLFDSACMAVNNGYNFEAVASLAAAFERFMEYYIRIILMKNNIPSQEIDKSWKQVLKQSERQLGGFIFLYLLENKIAMPPIEKWRGFRNDVIHRGVIPSRDRVTAQGEKLFTLIKDNLNFLKRNCKEFIDKEKSEKAPKEAVDAALFIPTMICTITEIDEGPNSFEECLTEIKELMLRAYDK